MKKARYLIVSESLDAVRSLREKIEKVLQEDAEVTAMDAAQFVPTDLLQADGYFFGADKLDSSEFQELARVLKGINLAGRVCGLFSTTSVLATEGLSSMVADAETRLNPVAFIEKDAADGDALRAWISETLQRR